MSEGSTGVVRINGRLNVPLYVEGDALSLLEELANAIECDAGKARGVITCRDDARALRWALETILATARSENSEE